MIQIYDALHKRIAAIDMMDDLKIRGQGTVVFISEERRGDRGAGSGKLHPDEGRRIRPEGDRDRGEEEQVCREAEHRGTGTAGIHIWIRIGDTDGARLPGIRLRGNRLDGRHVHGHKAPDGRHRRHVHGVGCPSGRTEDVHVRMQHRQHPEGDPSI